jgi:hypothetical protein
MLRGCFSMVLGTTLLVVLLVVGFLKRDQLAELARGAAGRVLDRQEEPVELAGATPPELAGQAERKVIALGQGESEEVTLSSEELSGWIEHRLAGFFPEYISDVRASIGEDRLNLSGRVATASIPGLEQLGPAANFLPDTAEIATVGRLDGLELGRGVYLIETLQIGALPLPDAWRDDVLTRLKGDVDDGLPLNAVSFELPPFVSDIGVRDGRVFLRATRRRS